jgi:hypothetical protein
MVFLEVSGGESTNSPPLFMETGGERVAVADGAALHVVPTPRERVIFTLSTQDGVRLCNWIPSLLIATHSPPQFEDGFSELASHLFLTVFFFNVGEPIRLELGGKLAGGSAGFQIDGLQAVVLARSPCEVILRDPRPTIGFRTVVSQGYSTALRFVQVESQFSKPSLKGRATLTIKITGFDLVKKRSEEVPTIFLENYSEEAMTVLCGKLYRNDRDRYNAWVISPHREGGEFVAVCKVRLHAKGRANLEAMVGPTRPFDPTYPFRHRAR